MEYVAGLPITLYCDRHKLNTRQRLKLFISVCEDVQHAHQKAIIHRDLKPSNILVMEVDGKPVPRIIDFGIAKATAHRLSGETLHTEVGALIGTLGYINPEQADYGGVDIDTRSDVYSLGWCSMSCSAVRYHSISTPRLRRGAALPARTRCSESEHTSAHAR
jgi:eukaryotic-like serine/threonine-protein kinase